MTGERQTFNCQERDRENAFFDLSDRNYDPNLGRFVRPDRLWEKERALSPYHYCANNPERLTDPSGMQVNSSVEKADNGGGGGGGGGDFITPFIRWLAGGGSAAAGFKDRAVELGQQIIVRGTNLWVNLTKDLSKFKEAGKYGIDTYTKLKQVVAGQGLEVHHLIEKRFAGILDIAKNDIPSIALTKAEHLQRC